MKNKKNICLAVCLSLLSTANITAFAKEQKDVYLTEISRYSVEYGREVEKDKEDQCEVYIAIPWEFTNTIPKTPLEKEEYRPVQTGDYSGIGGQIALMALSALGIYETVRHEKKKQ